MTVILDSTTYLGETLGLPQNFEGEGKQSFFEKKDQKTFVPGAGSAARTFPDTPRRLKQPRNKSFLVLFFKKGLLALPHQPSRRALILALGALPFAARAQSNPVLRLGTLPFGTVQWIASTIVRNKLDSANGFVLKQVTLANTEAAKTALMGSAVDVAVSDWPFVAAQRAHGGHLTFSPFSGSLGGIVVPAGSLLSTLADLKGKRVGVAGGPQDKSWLLVRAAAQSAGVDLTKMATLSFGAPPLLSAELQQGRLDALLTFWNFAAKLQAAGYRQMLGVADCARLLGFDPPPVLVGYVFDDIWANGNRKLIDGFLRAANTAANLLATKPDEWNAIRPLMDAKTDTEAAALRLRFLAGLGHTDPAIMQAQAAKLTAFLAKDAPANRTPTLPPGVFWHGA